MVKVLKSKSRVNNGQFGQLLRAKKGFLAAVYSLLCIQLVITALTIWYLRKHQDLHEKMKKWWIVTLILTLGILLVILFVPMPTPLKLLLITLFSVMIGISSIAANDKVPMEIIQKAVVSVIMVFIVMTVIGFTLAAMGVDLSFLTYILMCALVALVIGWLVVIFGNVSKGFMRILLIIGVVLFSIYIGYDTNMILQRTYYGDFVNASIDFYLDIINLFSSLVGLDLMD